MLDIKKYDVGINLIYSQEGLKEFIKDIKQKITGKDEHGVKKNDKKPGIQINTADKYYSNEARKSLKDLKLYIEKFYLNDNWLNNQTLIDSEIEIKDVCQELNFNGKLGANPLENIKNGISWRKSIIDKYIPHVKNFVKEIDQIDKTLKNKTNGTSPDDADIAEKIKLVEKAINEMDNLPDPLASFPKINGVGLGNKYPTAEKNKNGWELSIKVSDKFEKKDTSPSLTKEQIKEAANLILTVLELDDDFSGVNLPWLDHSDGSKFNRWLQDTDEGVFLQYYSKFDYHSGDDTYIYPLYHLIDEFATASTLERLIDRSIK